MKEMKTIEIPDPIRFELSDKIAYAIFDTDNNMEATVITSVSQYYENRNCKQRRWIDYRL